MKSIMKKNKDFKFPCLGIRNRTLSETRDDVGTLKYDDVTIVLFEIEAVGTVVFTKGFLNRKKMGEYSKTWDMEMFEPFYGKVVIE